MYIGNKSIGRSHSFSKSFLGLDVVLDGLSADSYVFFCYLVLILVKGGEKL